MFSIRGQVTALLGSPFVPLPQCFTPTDVLYAG